MFSVVFVTVRRRYAYFDGVRGNTAHL